MGKSGFIQTPYGPMFENPDLRRLIVSELDGIDLKELFMQPSVLVPGDDCAEHRVSGIFYVAFTKDGKRISDQLVAQGSLARSLFDPFGKRRVRRAMASIKEHFEARGVSVHEEERLYK